MEINSSTKILSFDVGIKNLAYCLMQVDNFKFKILKWDIINLATDRKTCCLVKQNGEICDTIANYSLSLNKHNVHYYCSQHIEKATLYPMDVNIRLIECEPDDEMVYCCGDTITKSKCNAIGIYSINLLEGSYCKKHINKKLSKENFLCCKKNCSKLIRKAIYSYSNNNENNNDNNDNNSMDSMMTELYCGFCEDHFDEEYKDLIKKKTKSISQNCNKIPLDHLACSMYQQLDRMPELLEVDEVFVENQPTFINPTMKTISSILYGYFILRGIYEKNKTKSNIKEVSFCSPSNKLKVGGKSTDDKLNETEKPKVYKMTKNLGVSYCKKLIEDDQKIVEHLEHYKKKDDLCDSFLQAFVMIFNPMPDYYYQKIKTLLADEGHKKTSQNTVDNIEINDNILEKQIIKKDKKGNTFYFGKKKYYKKKNN